MSFRCKSCMRDFKNLRDCMAHEKHCAITPSQRDESMASQPSITTYRANMARQFFQSELGDNDISNNSKCSDSVNNIEYDDDISDVDEEHYRILSCPKMEDVYTVIDFSTYEPVLKEHPDGYLTSEFLSGIHLDAKPLDDIQKLFKIEYDDVIDDDGNKENIPPMRDAIEHTDERSICINTATKYLATEDSYEYMQLSYNILSGEDDRNPSQMCDISPEKKKYTCRLFWRTVNLMSKLYINELMGYYLVNVRFAGCCH
ncbi:hypothetical protein BDQ17DRAFT_1331877 [Cyathus striatus]|nr:hypothetical protein BDQ17DRAFT_1331877 [Cyathus striatus]